jgi:hypothetical protein
VRPGRVVVRLVFSQDRVQMLLAGVVDGAVQRLCRAVRAHSKDRGHRRGPTTPSPVSPRSRSSVCPSSAASSTNTSEPRRSPGQHRWPSSGIPQAGDHALVGPVPGRRAGHLVRVGGLGRDHRGARTTVALASKAVTMPCQTRSGLRCLTV